MKITVEIDVPTLVLLVLNTLAFLRYQVAAARDHVRLPSTER